MMVLLGLFQEGEKIEGAGQATDKEGGDHKNVLSERTGWSQLHICAFLVPRTSHRCFCYT